MKLLLRATLLATIAVGFLTGTVTQAAPAGDGTLDGMPPANEGVCDVLIGGSPGLYGLCVAYCEAQDLDGLDMNDPTTHNKNVPNAKILANYNNKKKEGDPDMPCIKPVCPCWDQAEIDQIFTRMGTTVDYDGCSDTTRDSYYEAQSILENGRGDDIFFQNFAVATNYYPDGHYSNLGTQCAYFDLEYIYSAGEYTSNIYRTFKITPEEYAGCKQQIVDRAAAANVTCQVINY